MEPYERLCMKDFVLAFDTANEMISIGLGKLDREVHAIEIVASNGKTWHVTKLLAWCADVVQARLRVYVSVWQVRRESQ